MPPLVFRPLLRRIRWGGTRLGSVLGKPIGDDVDVAESWEVCDHGVDQSVVDGGPLDGWTLQRLVRERNDELLGRQAGRTQFPLLIKFLDATDRLSVQVHPDDALAVRFDPAENGKTEAWVVLDAKPGSPLFAGLREGVDEPTLRAAIDEGRVAECLHEFAVRSGDCVLVPAGTVHAIGEGILLAEVQQSSDLTFRLHDWGRVDADGNPRPLHVESAMKCIDFARGPVGPVPPVAVSGFAHDVEELVACDFFAIRRHRCDASTTIPRNDQFRVWTTIGGGGVLRWGDGSRDVGLGTTFLLPASAPDVVFEPESPTTLLETFLPS